MDARVLNPCIKFTMLGDSRRLSITVTCIKQAEAFNYIKRLESLKNSNQEMLSGNLFVEQEYVSRKLQEQLGVNRPLDAVKGLRNIESKFKRLWSSAMPLNRKLHFHNIVKSEIAYIKMNEFMKEDELLHN